MFFVNSWELCKWSKCPMGHGSMAPYMTMVFLNQNVMASIGDKLLYFSKLDKLVAAPWFRDCYCCKSRPPSVPQPVLGLDPGGLGTIVVEEVSVLSHTDESFLREMKPCLPVADAGERSPLGFVTHGKGKVRGPGAVRDNEGGFPWTLTTLILKLKLIE